MKRLAYWVIVASWTDAWATAIAVAQGKTEEANPLMGLVYSDPWAFVLIKMTLTVSGVAVLHYYSNKRPARWGLSIVSLCYLVVTTMHLYIWTL